MATLNLNDFDSLLGGSVPETKAKKSKALTAIPDVLKDDADAIIRGRAQLKATEARVAIAETRIKAALGAKVIAEYTRARALPGSTTYQSDAGTLNFVQTTRTTMNRARLEALKEIGFPVSEHVEIGELSIDFAAVERLGLAAKMMAALKTVASPAELAQVLAPSLKAKPTIFPAIATWANGDEKKVTDAMAILAPVVQMKAVATGAEDAS